MKKATCPGQRALEPMTWRSCPVPPFGSVCFGHAAWYMCLTFLFWEISNKPCLWESVKGETQQLRSSNAQEAHSTYYYTITGFGNPCLYLCVHITEVGSKVRKHGVWHLECQVSRRHRLEYVDTIFLQIMYVISHLYKRCSPTRESLFFFSSCKVIIEH